MKSKKVRIFAIVNSMLHYLKLMLQLAMSPAKGWEDIAASADTSRRTLIRGLLPVIGVSALTVFIGAFYALRPAFGPLLIGAVVMFAKYIITYFIGVAVLTFALPRLAGDEIPERDKVEIFCAYSVGLMAAIGILENLLPMQLSLLQFLPLAVIVVMCLGKNYLHIDDGRIFQFAAVVTLSLVLPVFLIGSLVGAAA